MAWARTQLSAESRAAYASDKPILFGHNILEGTTQSAWRTWTGSDDWTGYATSATNYDAANSSYPLYRVWDDRTYLQSKAALPGALTDTDRWATVFSFPASTFDTLAIINHNFGALSNFYGYNANPANPDFYVYAWIGDDADFTSNVAKVYTWKNPTNDKPLVGFNLSNVAGVGTTYEQYSGVTNAQISLVCSAATMGTGTGQPTVGEILFGTRVQLRHQATVPYSDNNLFSDANTIAPTGGQFRRYARSSGGMRFENTYTVTSAERGDINTWFSSHISHGLKHFLYVPRPTKAEGGASYLVGAITPAAYSTYSEGEAYWVALEQDSFSLNTVEGPFEQVLELTMKEIAPYNERVT